MENSFFITNLNEQHTTRRWPSPLFQRAMIALLWHRIVSAIYVANKAKFQTGLYFIVWTIGSLCCLHPTI
jgi:hypothetical protein